MDEVEIKQMLHDMEEDEHFDTSSIPVRKDGLYAHEISFFKKHTTYLKSHPKVNPEIYLANLKTMIRKRI